VAAVKLVVIIVIMTMASFGTARCHREGWHICFNLMSLQRGVHWVTCFEGGIGGSGKDGGHGGHGDDGKLWHPTVPSEELQHLLLLEFFAHSSPGVMDLANTTQEVWKWFSVIGDDVDTAPDNLAEMSVKTNMNVSENDTLILQWAGELVPACWIELATRDPM
jgi:hypothetical protein